MQCPFICVFVLHVAVSKVEISQSKPLKARQDPGRISGPGYRSKSFTSRHGVPGRLPNLRVQLRRDAGRENLDVSIMYPCKLLYLIEPFLKAALPDAACWLVGWLVSSPAG
ncbi:hypothetical protein ABZP36_002408 [Zizania latifolia]